MNEGEEEEEEEEEARVNINDDVARYKSQAMERSFRPEGRGSVDVPGVLIKLWIVNYDTLACGAAPTTNCRT